MPECPIKLKPMSEWVKEEDTEGSCRTCVLTPVVQWYMSELEERGKKALAKELETVAEADDSDYLKICQKLDSIKEKVEPALADRLLEFDCAAQTFKPEEMPE